MRVRPALLLALLALPLRAADVPIHDFQGSGAESPRAGQTVSTTGVFLSGVVVAMRKLQEISGQFKGVADGGKVPASMPSPPTVGYTLHAPRALVKKSF